MDAHEAADCDVAAVASVSDLAVSCAELEWALDFYQRWRLDAVVDWDGIVFEENDEEYLSAAYLLPSPPPSPPGEHGSAPPSSVPIAPPPPVLIELEAPAHVPMAAHLCPPTLDVDTACADLDGTSAPLQAGVRRRCVQCKRLTRNFWCEECDSDFKCQQCGFCPGCTFATPPRDDCPVLQQVELVLSGQYDTSDDVYVSESSSLPSSPPAGDAAPPALTATERIRPKCKFCRANPCVCDDGIEEWCDTHDMPYRDCPCQVGSRGLSKDVPLLCSPTLADDDSGYDPGNQDCPDRVPGCRCGLHLQLASDALLAPTREPPVLNLLEHHAALSACSVMMIGAGGSSSGSPAWPAPAVGPNLKVPCLICKRRAPNRWCDVCDLNWKCDVCTFCPECDYATPERPIEWSNAAVAALDSVRAVLHLYTPARLAGAPLPASLVRLLRELTSALGCANPTSATFSSVLAVVDYLEWGMSPAPRDDVRTVARAQRDFWLSRGGKESNFRVWLSHLRTAPVYAVIVTGAGSAGMSRADRVRPTSDGDDSAAGLAALAEAAAAHSPAQLARVVCDSCHRIHDPSYVCAPKVGMADRPPSPDWNGGCGLSQHERVCTCARAEYFHEWKLRAAAYRTANWPVTGGSAVAMPMVAEAPSSDGGGGGGNLDEGGGLIEVEGGSASTDPAPTDPISSQLREDAFHQQSLPPITDGVEPG